MEFKERENLEMIRDLVAVNQDRFNGYSTLATYLNEKNDEDILALIEETMQQSQQYKSQLIPFAFPEEDEGFQPPFEKRLPWSITPQADAPNMSQTHLLNICINAERETQHVYELALKNSESMDHSLARMIDSQREGVANTVEELKKLCPTPTSEHPSAENNHKF